MTWTKLGDEFPAEARKLTDAEFRTHVEALCWSNLRLLDLVVPKQDVRRFAESPDAELAVKGLADKEWWADRGDSWDIGCRFSDWQEERVVVDKRRDDAATRKRRSRLHKAGDHSLCLPGGTCPHVTRDGLRDETRRGGRVGTGLSDPPDPTVQNQDPTQLHNQRRVGDGVDDKQDPMGTSTGSQTGSVANLQDRQVSNGSNNDGAQAPQFSLHDSESITTGTGARASETEGQRLRRELRERRLGREHPEAS